MNDLSSLKTADMVAACRKFTEAFQQFGICVAELGRRLSAGMAPAFDRTIHRRVPRRTMKALRKSLVGAKLSERERARLVKLRASGKLVLIGRRVIAP